MSQHDPKGFAPLETSFFDLPENAVTDPSQLGPSSSIGGDIRNIDAPTATGAFARSAQTPMVTPGQIPQMGPSSDPGARAPSIAQASFMGDMQRGREGATFMGPSAMPQPGLTQGYPLVQQLGIVPGADQAASLTPMGPVEGALGTEPRIAPTGTGAAAAGPSRADRLGGMFLAGSGLQAFGQGYQSPSAAEPLGALGMTVAGVGKMLGAGAWTTPVAIGATLLNMFGQMQAGSINRNRRQTIFNAYSNALKSAGRIYRG